MKLKNFTAFCKWFKTKFPTLKQLERKQFEERLKIQKELKKKKEK